MGDITLDTERKIGADDAAWLIRNPDPEAARVAAEQLKMKQKEEFATIRRLDDIKLKLNSGATLSTDEQNFLKTQETLANQPTEEQKRAAQEAAAKTEADKKAAEGAGGTGAGSGKNLEQMDALIQKLEKGEALTDEEAKLALELEQKPVVPDKTYKVGGKELKFEEALTQMWKKYGIDTPPDLPVDTLTRMVDTFMVEVNKEAWQTAQTQRDQQLARNKRTVSDASLRILAASETLKNDLERTHILIGELEVLAKRPTNQEELYDTQGRIDPVKQREFNKIMDAREELPKKQNEFKSLQERSVQTERDLVVQRFRDFQEANPEYATSQDVGIAAGALGSGRLSTEDETRIGEMIRIFREADATRSTPQQEHDYRLQLGMLAVKPTAASATSRDQQDPSKFRKDQESDRQKLLDNLKKKREAARSISGAGAPERKVAMSKTTEHAWNIAASSRREISGGALTNAQKLADAGY